MDRLAFDHEELSGQVFSGRKLDSFTSIGSRFVGCRFEKLWMGNANLGAGTEISEYVDCSFDGTRMPVTHCGYSRFVRCTFRNAKLNDWRGEYLELVDCTFTGKISKSMFWGSLPEVIKQGNLAGMVSLFKDRGGITDSHRQLILRDANEFHGNDFSGAELINVTFRNGIDLERQTLPTGPDYLYLPDAATSIQRVREQVADRTSYPATASMLNFLDILSDRVADGQRQLLIRPKNFGRVVPPDVALACELLASTLT
jgi:uncharacterized protein YjbI with pentapeptide repeats